MYDFVIDFIIGVYMENIIVSGIILLILTAAISKVFIEKRKGNKCIGCPHGGKTGNCSCSHTK